MRSESETISDSSFTVHVGLKTAEFTNEHTEEGFLLLNILICREKGLSVFSLSFNTLTSHTHTLSLSLSPTLSLSLSLSLVL